MAQTLTAANILYIAKDASFNAKKSQIDASNAHSITFLPESNAIYANKHMFKAEDPSNKVTTISSSSTDKQYPSAKATYTAIDNVNSAVVILSTQAEKKTNKVTTLSASVTDNQYPSAKVVYDTIIENEEVTAAALNTLNANKENISNKVTSISASSTDTQYPSAKAVYDIIGNVESALAAI